MLETSDLVVMGKSEFENSYFYQFITRYQSSASLKFGLTCKPSEGNEGLLLSFLFGAEREVKNLKELKAFLSEHKEMFFPDDVFEEEESFFLALEAELDPEENVVQEYMEIRKQRIRSLLEIHTPSKVSNRVLDDISSPDHHHFQILSSYIADEFLYRKVLRIIQKLQSPQKFFKILRLLNKNDSMANVYFLKFLGTRGKENIPFETIISLIDTLSAEHLVTLILQEFNNKIFLFQEISAKDIALYITQFGLESLITQADNDTSTRVFIRNLKTFHSEYKFHEM